MLVIDSKWDKSVSLQIFDRVSTIIIDLDGGNSFLKAKCAKDVLGNPLYFTMDRILPHQIFEYLAKWNQCESPHNYPHVYAANDRRIQDKLSIIPPFFQLPPSNTPCWSTLFHVDKDNYVIKKRLPCDRLRKITLTQEKPAFYPTILIKTVSSPNNGTEKPADPLLNDMPLSSNPEVAEFLDDSEDPTETTPTPSLNLAEPRPEFTEDEQNNEDTYNDYLS